jgi:spore germination protein YaaH
MTFPRRRPLAVAVSLLCLLGASPVGAADPQPAPATGSPPTIHAEMATEMAAAVVDEPMAFTPGARPMALSADGTTQTVEGTAAGLPNGLAREVFGYLPYWAVTSPLLASMNYDRLSTIAYFGLAARSDGTLAKSGATWSAWTSSLMTDVINAAHAEGVKVVLTVTMMAWDGDYAAMTSVLNNATRRSQLAAEIAATVAARNADGVNLDFEPMPNSLQSAYTTFVRDVKAALGSRYLTVATTAGAATWDEGYDLSGLVAPGAADALMVMGYDINWSGSSRAGGVAPIQRPEPTALDVAMAMDDFTAAVSPSKLIWGVPYYGRAWTTTSASLNGRTCHSAGTCTAASWSFRYADAVPAAATHGRKWDPGGQVPWYTYASSTYDAQVQSYYDDAASLDVKYDLVNAHGMRGIGIWHLLMDAGRSELWDVIGQNLLALPFNDIDDSIHWQNIVWIAEQGITTGCGNGRYCPDGLVTRGQMATFLARALELPATETDYFRDDNANKHEANINRIAAAGVTAGCTATTFCPDGVVTRAQMATFLARALHLPATATDFFRDDETNKHEANINRIAAAGLTVGCTSTTYCPNGAVTRAQMATFLRRGFSD